MALKTLKVELEDYTEKIAPYLLKIKIKEPEISNNSICHYTKYGAILTEPNHEELFIQIVLDDKSPALGELEKLIKGEEN
ncbi:MAG: hypothetical protein WC812_02535 [Candidatus Pacearchaeota archaeon]|jgi:hypothetical protein